MPRLPCFGRRRCQLSPAAGKLISRAAGSHAGNCHSVALEASGVVWSEAALRACMEDNTGVLPGTRMRHVVIVDRTVQDFILAHLRSITRRDPRKVVA